MDRISPEFKALNAVFELDRCSLVKSSVELSEDEVQSISDILRKEKEGFNLKQQLSYLKRGSHIRRVGKGRILSEPFLVEPDFETEVRLQFYLRRGHCLQRFDRHFVEEALSAPIDSEILEEIDFRKEEYEEDAYDEYSCFKKSAGWHVCGRQVKSVWSIDELEDFYIIGGGSDNLWYVRRGERGFRQVHMPGEFTGTGDFLWIQ